MAFGLLSQDSFLNGRVTLFQPEIGYRAAIDPVFLAAGFQLVLVTKF